MAASDAVSSTTIVDLPDECLRKVMIHIPIQARIHLREVCKKWCEVIDDCWHSVKVVQFHEPTEQKHGMWGQDGTVSIATSSRKIYEGVMKRCGDSVMMLTDHREEPKISPLPFAAKHCRNILRLELTVSSKADDKHMNRLLAANKKLRALFLHINFKDAKMCLRTVATDYLEVLSIDALGKYIFPPSILMSQKQIIRKAASLKHLITYFVDEELINLIGQKVLFEGLGVTYCGNSLERDTFYPILNLKNLQILCIRASVKVVQDECQVIAPPVTDDFLIALVGNLQLLEYLALSGPYITDRGLVHLASLPKLQQLELSFGSGITNKFLYVFARLEKLILIGCNIRDEGVIKLLKKTKTMRVLNLTGTLITNKTLIAAIKETKKRDNGISLKLNVFGTPTSPSTITESSPLLEIVNERARRL